MTAPLLEVRNLSVTYGTSAGTVHALDDVSFTVRQGATLGLVGESGCGKTTAGRAIIKVMPANAAITSGEIRYKGQDLVPLSYKEMQAVRWKEIAVVPQSAMNALNPVFRVGKQIEEVFIHHLGVGAAEARARAETLFRLVKIDPARLKHYPHQFSGGMRQRALVAMALALNPSLLIADEPTTALDVVTQDRIFTRVRALQKQLGASMLLITHDMGLVAENTDRIAVMYAGRIVEYGDTRTLFKEPVHPYTLGLKNAFPSMTRPKHEALISIAGAPPVLLDPPRACRFAPRCPFATALCHKENPPLEEVAPGHFAACHHLAQAAEMRARAALSETWVASVPTSSGRSLEKDTTPVISAVNVRKWFAARGELAGLFARGEGAMVHAVDDVSFEIGQGEILGLIGESGSGKTTLGRLIVRLESYDAGDIVFQDGRVVGALKARELRDYYRDVQMIFQDPYGSINPRFTVFDTVVEPLKTQRLGASAEWGERVVQALDRAGLRPPAAFVDKYPHELSGGERQRLSIARALVLEPKLIVADEPVSMLDVSIRAGILNLLKSLSKESGLTILYISHDLSTTRHLCDRIVIMYRGKFVEVGDAARVIDGPLHPYAQALKAAIPVPDPEISRDRADTDFDAEDLEPDLTACRYAQLCPHAMARCSVETPELRRVEADHEVACFLYEEGSG